MPAVLSPGTELKRFGRGVLPKLAVLIMVVVPVLYACMYVWAFWNPTGKIDRIPVALVNQDRPVTVDGKQVDAGRQVERNLLDEKPLDLRPVSEREAVRGVSHGTYYFAVTIPQDFSARIGTAGQQNPSHAELQVLYNETNSFLGTTLGKSAMAAIRAAVSEGIGDQASQQVLVGLGRARAGFVQGSDGAFRLADGSSTLGQGLAQARAGIDQLDAGAGRLAAGAGTAGTGAKSLASGAASANTGAQQLAQGAGRLAAGTGQLATGAGALATGAQQADAGAQALAGGTGSYLEGVKKASAGLDAYASQAFDGQQGLVAGSAAVSQGVDGLVDRTTQGVTDLSALNGQLEALAAANAGNPTGQALTRITQGLDTTIAEDQAQAGQLTALRQGAAAVSTGAATARQALEGYRVQAFTGTGAENPGLVTGAERLDSAARQLAAGTSQVGAGAQALSTSSRRLDSGAQSLAAGSTSLAGGTSQLTTGANALSDGVVSLLTGANQLHDGTGRLEAGAPRLTDGAAQLHSGAQELGTRLHDGATGIPDDDHRTRLQRAAALSNPVHLAASYQHRTKGYGEGFAPYFVSLALWVGALVVWLLLRPVSSRALAFNTSGLRAVLTSYTAAAAIGVGQGLAVMAVMHWAVGLDPVHLWGTVLFTVLVAWSFLAVQQMFNIVFGVAPGKVVTLVMLILQLVASGGTYPTQTTPGFLQWIHPVMPMTYSVNGLRALVTGGIDGRLWTAVAVLTAIALGSIALSAARARADKTWTMSRLHPELVI